MADFRKDIEMLQDEIGILKVKYSDVLKTIRQLADDKKLFEGIDVNGNMKTVVRGYVKDGVNYVTEITREKIDKDWNLADDGADWSEEANEDIKKCRDLILEDINKLIKLEGEDDVGLINSTDVAEIINKRFGDL